MANEKDPSLQSQKPPSLLRLLADALSSLFGSSSRVSDLRQKSDDTNNPNNNTNEITQRREIFTNAPIRVAIDSIPAPKSPTDEEKAEKKKKQEDKQFKTNLQLWATLITGGLLGINILLWCSTKKSADAATIAANAAKRSADTAINSHYWATQDRRPWIWVKPSPGLQIEVGKPMKATVEVFNYGNSPGLARTMIHIEAGPGVIEKFRDECKNHGASAYLIPDDKNAFTAIIPPQSGTKDFPAESLPTIVSRKDYDRIMNGIRDGTLDVAIYGRIWSSDVKRPWRDRFDSIFCFHLLRDRTIAACPNEQNAYTNFMAPESP